MTELVRNVALKEAMRDLLDRFHLLKSGEYVIPLSDEGEGVVHISITLPSFEGEKSKKK